MEGEAKAGVGDCLWLLSGSKFFPNTNTPFAIMGLGNNMVGYILGNRSRGGVSSY